MKYVLSFRPGGACIRPLLVAVAIGIGIGAGPAYAQSSANVMTYHNDNARTGQNLREPNLTLQNVDADHFGLLFTYPVDGWMFAQPLYVSGLSIPGRGVHNVLFVATEHGSVYAFDADDNQGANADPLWQVSVINPAAGVTTVPIQDYGYGEPPELCITGTPVIDGVSGTLYVVAQTKETDGEYSVYVHRLYALDIYTGTEQPGSPVVIQPSVSGTGIGSDDQNQIAFSGFNQLQRPGLLLLNGVVYAAFGSIGDIDPYHGWLLGYDAKTLGLLQAFNDTPNGQGGGLWMSGGGTAADAAGNLYCLTGNGDFDAAKGGLDYGDSFLRLSAAGTNLVVSDYFAPYNQATLNVTDGDLGSGGPLVLPAEAGSAAHPHLLVGAGKAGTIYLLDRDHLGGFNPLDDSQIVQSLSQIIGSEFSTPAYFNHYIYFLGVQDVLKAFAITNGQMSRAPVSQAGTTFGFTGATPSISANGINNAIVWVVQVDAWESGGPAILRAYNATNLTQELYNSNQADSRDQLGPALKFTVPTVANGKVYVGTAFGMSVFGLLGVPMITRPPASQVALSGSSVTLEVSAQSDSPLSYQWQFKGTNMIGATHASLTLPRIDSSQAGQYSGVVAHSQGSITSLPATIHTINMAVKGDVSFSFEGPIDSVYRIEYLSDWTLPLQWTTLTNIVITNSPYRLVDIQSTNVAQRFYRATLLP